MFKNCKINDISVVPTSKASTALTLIMLDRLNITTTKPTNVGQLIRGSIIKSWNELMGNQDRQNHKHFSGELLKSLMFIGPCIIVTVEE